MNNVQCTIRIVLGKVAKGGHSIAQENVQLEDNDRHVGCRPGQKDRLADLTQPQFLK